MQTRNAFACVFAVACLGMLPADAQSERPKPLSAWAPQPVKLAPFTAPNKLLWKLTDILAAHKGQNAWEQTVALTRDYYGRYIQMAPGEKTKTLFYADDRTFWVVESGQIRFTIEGQQPFVATKGFLVQVPYRVPYMLETVGNEPSLRFEVGPSYEKPSYVSTETPPSIPGWKYVKANYTGKGKYDDKNKPFLDFQKEIVEGGGKGGGFVNDDHTWANVIRGKGAPVPPDTEWGHFHENFPEFWIVLEGQEDFLIQGEKLISTHTGDIVFAPEERWHRVTHGGTGFGTRLAITPRPPSLHYTQLGSSGGD
jgi:mannose-6-phosphate isomerase-like protein (cupin superfamily)